MGPKNMSIVREINNGDTFTRRDNHTARAD